MDFRVLDDTEIAGFAFERKWLDDFLRQFGPEHVLTRTPDDIPTLSIASRYKTVSTGTKPHSNSWGQRSGCRCRNARI